MMTVGGEGDGVDIGIVGTPHRGRGDGHPVVVAVRGWGQAATSPPPYSSTSTTAAAAAALPHGTAGGDVAEGSVGGRGLAAHGLIVCSFLPRGNRLL